MQTPYRKAEEPLARYPLRTHASYYALLVMSALLLTPAVWVFARFGAYALSHASTYLMLASGALVLGVTLTSGRQLRVPRGAELKIHRDRLELPGYRRGDVLTAPIGDVRVTLVRHPTNVVLIGFIPVGSVDGGVSLTFELSGSSRVLSHRAFGSVEVAERAFADVLRVQEGLTPDGPDGRPPLEPTRNDDEYDQRIDEELRRMG